MKAEGWNIYLDVYVRVSEVIRKTFPLIFTWYFFSKIKNLFLDTTFSEGKLEAMCGASSNIF